MTTVAGAYSAVFGRIGALLRAWLAPLLYLAVLVVVSDLAPDNWILTGLFWLLALPPATLFAVATHRVILLGPDSLTNPWSIYWTQRESDFLWWLFVLGIGAALLVVALEVTALMSPQTILGTRVPWLPGLFVFMTATYFVGRLGLVFPATALGRRQILSNSWTLTIGNGARLLVALAVPWGIYKLLLELILAGFAPKLPVVVAIIGGVIALLTVAVEIAVLSLAYRELQTADYVPDAG
ncbi:MAG: hypothetical protein ACE5F8_01605 [Woeseiaceae bacterium]